MPSEKARREGRQTQPLAEQETAEDPVQTLLESVNPEESDAAAASTYSPEEDSQGEAEKLEIENYPETSAQDGPGDNGGIKEKDESQQGKEQGIIDPSMHFHNLCALYVS